MVEVITVLKECGALLEGHFLLSSGRHSDKYFQCARLLQYPERAAAVLSPLADTIQSARQAGRLRIDAVIGPALGGILVAYELGRLLAVPALFSERDEQGIMTLRRGFEVAAGSSWLIAEDVVTTGRSWGECQALIEARGAVVSAVACIIDRRDPHENAKLPFYAAAKVQAQSWDPAECFLCRQGIPFFKPGSRR
ncbi:MAG: orotate phosphoribosyltransferase [Spirochaetaceae bacterium]|jgi:orotate phosphoribosyltransferase|nr:orotate phosphoribosyltransferase [Spirochaetaceae bacterium]